MNSLIEEFSSLGIRETTPDKPVIGYAPLSTFGEILETYESLFLLKSYKLCTLQHDTPFIFFDKEYITGMENIIRTLLHNVGVYVTEDEISEFLKVEGYQIDTDDEEWDKNDYEYAVYR